MASEAVTSEVSPLLSWNVEQLKDYLREYHLPVTGVKSELIQRIRDCLDTRFLETEIGANTFQHFHDDKAIFPEFTSLPEGPWREEDFPVVKEKDAKDYLRKKGGYTKNYRTGVRLCQCGHLYAIEMAQEKEVIYMRARCRPTMRTKPPFYFLFVMLCSDTKMPIGGNCFCAAGASQSCVHIAAMLFTLAEVTATACTSVRCAWARPSVGNKVGSASFSSELDFGNASQDGYFPYDGQKPPIHALLKSFADVGSKPAIIDFLDGEREREAMVKVTNSCQSTEVLKDPLDKLASIATVREPTVDDLVDALCVTVEEAELIQIMTIGQRDNPVWMDARQWRITASNFGRVCNRNFRVLYPPSLRKMILGDYGHPISDAINWGCEHENAALEAYQQRTAIEVDVCGLFLSIEFPFLGATPDGLMYTGLGMIAVVEVKCPYKHRNSTIIDACKDSKFCLTISDLGEPRLKRNHDYYYQIIGQLGITGAEYCDFVVWTLLDMHIERVFMDADVWQDITKKLKEYYYTELGPEIIQRLLNM